MKIFLVIFSFVFVSISCNEEEERQSPAQVEEPKPIRNDDFEDDGSTGAGGKDGYTPPLPAVETEDLKSYKRDYKISAKKKFDGIVNSLKIIGEDDQDLVPDCGPIETNELKECGTTKMEDPYFKFQFLSESCQGNNLVITPVKDENDSYHYILELTCKI